MASSSTASTGLRSPSAPTVRRAIECSTRATAVRHHAGRNTSRRRRAGAAKSFPLRPAPVIAGTRRWRMRHLRTVPLLMILILAAAAAGSAADAPPPRPCVHGANLRAMQPWIGAARRTSSRRARRRWRTLIAELQRGAGRRPCRTTISDGHHRLGRPAAIRHPRRRLPLLCASTCATPARPEVRAALLAHELQHAVEVAQGRQSTTAGPWRRLFRRIGVRRALTAAARRSTPPRPSPPGGGRSTEN